MNNQGLYDLLKEIFTGETWAYREYKAERLTALEVEVYAKEIARGKNNVSAFKDLVYHDNPFLKLVK